MLIYKSSHTYASKAFYYFTYSNLYTLAIEYMIYSLVSNGHYQLCSNLDNANP